MVKPRTLTEAAYIDIKKWILEGVITPGCKINLDHTASRLEISMTPVREALTKLQQEGLVEYFPRVGWKVAKLSKKRYFKYRELQVLLETTLTELALPYVTDEAIAKMEEANERLRHSIETLPQEDIADAVLKENDIIHMTFYSCYDNDVMVNMLQNVWDSMSFYRHVLFGTSYYKEIGYSDHKQLIDSIKKKDLQAAKYAMEHHLHEGPRCLEGVFDEEL